MIGRLLGLGHTLQVNPNWSRRDLGRGALITAGSILLFRPPGLLENAPLEIRRLWPKIMRSGSSESEMGISMLAAIKGGSAYLRLVISEGTFAQYYLACQELAQSNLSEADIIIKEMIVDSQLSWEKAAGMLILGYRVSHGNSSLSNPLQMLEPFLESEDPLLRFGAIVGLMRMRKLANLERFMRRNPKSPAAAEISQLVSNTEPALHDFRILEVYQTSFFRHPHIYPELIQDFQSCTKPKHVIWDVGCSAGLSAESFRMALLTAPDTSSKLQVIGTDVEPLALVYAERGKYLLEATSLVGTREWGYCNDGTEIEEFSTYAQSQGWSHWQAAGVLTRFFKIEDGSLGKTYTVRPDQRAEFGFDDITTQASFISDRSVDGAVYTNVHRLLPQLVRTRAPAKIYAKLAPGGKVYVSSLRAYTFDDFEQVFGPPLKLLRDGTMVYAKNV
ncbi:MAG: hypothetical protein HQ596_06360 [Candidatus Saganbacteria bacterium]|nr:hypothetical protein [Candidatus Saganbacteria bacterium]